MWTSSRIFYANNGWLWRPGPWPGAGAVTIYQQLLEDISEDAESLGNAASIDAGDCLVPSVPQELEELQLWSSAALEGGRVHWAAGLGVGLRPGGGWFLAGETQRATGKPRFRKGLSSPGCPGTGRPSVTPSLMNL